MATRRAACTTPHTCRVLFSHSTQQWHHTAEAAQHSMPCNPDASTAVYTARDSALVKHTAVGTCYTKAQAWCCHMCCSQTTRISHPQHHNRLLLLMYYRHTCWVSYAGVRSKVPWAPPTSRHSASSRPPTDWPRRHLLRPRRSHSTHTNTRYTRTVHNSSLGYSHTPTSRTNKTVF